MRSIECSTSALGVALLFILALLTIEGCTRAGAPPPPSSGSPGEEFSGERAWDHLEALVSIGPRASGTPAAAQARSHIVKQLEDLDVEVRMRPLEVPLEGVEPLKLNQITAVIPGASPDLFILLAPYDTPYFAEIPFVGANDGGSGPALLLELARVLAGRSHEYTLWLVFLEGEARLGRGGAAHEEERFLGSRAMVEDLESEGRLQSIRMVVAFNRVCDADLRIERDLASHRMYREEFWASAARLGRRDAFPAKRGFGAPQESHIPFVKRGVRRVVALADTSFGGDEPPGIYANTEDDNLAHCAPESLEAVGQVALSSIDTIERRLARIDRYARSPLARPAEDEVPEAAEIDAPLAEPESELTGDAPVEPVGVTEAQ